MLTDGSADMDTDREADPTDWETESGSERRLAEAEVVGEELWGWDWIRGAEMGRQRVG